MTNCEIQVALYNRTLTTPRYTEIIAPPHGYYLLISLAYERVHTNLLL